MIFSNYFYLIKVIFLNSYMVSTNNIILNKQLYLQVSKSVKLAIVVEGDQKAPFSIATRPRCRGGC